MTQYNQRFYKNRHEKTVYSAEKILSFVMDLSPDLKSAVDIGCGVGTWLKVLEAHGITDVLGMDGSWVDQGLLEIPKENFRVIDMNTDIPVDRRYDLAISLEVAEHLPQERAQGFIATLVRLSDMVLFSAAIPHQEGRNHINEQWPEYWAAFFRSYGYRCFDIIREKIWNDDKIRPWYKQNVFLFVNEKNLSSLHLGSFQDTPNPLALVHPEIFVPKMARSASIKGSWKLLRKALGAGIKQLVANLAGKGKA